jgi:ubiquinone/menaquinone biosynthesis C-methylase UbiE
MSTVPVAGLDALARTLAEAKRLSHQWLRPEPGHRLLDVGCGPATDTLALARLVAPEGEVDGVDLDPAMIEEANLRAEAAGLGHRVRHRVAPAGELPFPDAAFDGCRSERLFQHLDDPAAALAEMVRVTRPGGRVVVADTDHALSFVDCGEPELAERLIALRAASLPNGRSGRRLWGLFRRAGLEDLEVRVLPLVFTRLAEALAAADLAQAAGAAVRRGALAADEAQRLRASLEAAEAAGTFFGGGVLVLVAGSVPAAGV